MAGPFQVLFQWTQQDDRLGGWGEQYWNTGATIDTVQPIADELRVAWAQYKGDPSYCSQIRISDTTNFRNAETFTTNQVPQTPTPTTEADYPTTKALLRLTGGGANPRKTRQWVGGLRDRDVQLGGKWTPVPADTSLINAVFALLTNPAKNWAVRVLDPAVLPVPIIGFVDATGVVTAADGTIPNGATVRIKNVRNIKEMNGIWIVTKLTGNDYQLRGWTPTGITSIGKGKPSIRLQTYTFQPIAACKILKTSSHTVGKAPGQHSGRRRRRKV